MVQLWIFHVRKWREGAGGRTENFRGAKLQGESGCWLHPEQSVGVVL